MILIFKDRLIVAQAFDVQGGQISVNEARESIFTPDPNYRGLLGLNIISLMGLIIMV